MKSFILPLIFIAFTTTGFARAKDSVQYYLLPDSVKANSFITEIQTGVILTKKEFSAGIKDGPVKLYMEKSKNETEFVFEYDKHFSLVAKGIDVTPEPGELTWKYNFTETDVYKLLLATATDSAENFILYSGYVFIPKENKWKLIGTCKITGRWGTIKNPATFFSVLKKNQPAVHFNNIFCQRNNGSWKRMTGTNNAAPVINMYSNIDSAAYAIAEIKTIREANVSGKTDAIQNKDGIYYTILKEGNGRQVQVTDTVTVHYKGYLFSDGTIFDQTKDKPATFPLSRLIKGWQLGVPLCKVGGKIKLVIPSGLGYSIRTRAAKIPPNSILVFEIEVLDAKEEKLNS